MGWRQSGHRLSVEVRIIDRRHPLWKTSPFRHATMVKPEPSPAKGQARSGPVDGADTGSRQREQTSLGAQFALLMLAPVGASLRLPRCGSMRPGALDLFPPHPEHPWSQLIKTVHSHTHAHTHTHTHTHASAHISSVSTCAGRASSSASGVQICPT